MRPAQRRRSTCPPLIGALATAASVLLAASACSSAAMHGVVVLSLDAGRPDAAASHRDAGAAALDAGTPKPPADISAELQAIRADAGLPSLLAMAADSKHVLAQGVTGVRSIDGTDPVALDSRYHLGSETKAMTATVIATFVEHGDLSWEATLPELFPKLAGTIDPGYRAVTLAQLLEHLAGLPAEISAFDPTAWDKAFTDTRPVDVQREQWTAMVLAAPPASTPGSQYAYANLGYIIAGHALEVLTGRTWEQLIQERLFDALGMSSCGFGAPAATSADQPLGHMLQNGKLTAMPTGVGDDNPAMLGPAGTVHCAAADWLKFLTLHVVGHRGESDFLSKQTFLRMHTPPTGQTYAFGWMTADRGWAGGTALTHAGSNNLWYAVAWLAPKTDRIFIALTNRGGDVANTATDQAIASMVDRFGH
jgi:CubicO group peptidase (beta-lactamase class C family)